jgi:hypothetical protein
VASGEVQRLGQQANRPSGGNLVLRGRQDKAKAKRFGVVVARLLDDAIEDFELFIAQGLVNRTAFDLAKLLWQISRN